MEIEEAHKHYARFLRGAGMTIVFIIAAVIAAIYIYAAVAYYYGFKNWAPLCGCRGAECVPRKQS